MTTKARGVVLYDGPSAIDGKRIVVIASGLAAKSANAKTGAMVQTYILRADQRPTDAVKAGADVSICGTCPHRGDGNGKARTCYVNVGQGPLVVWKAWKRGVYPVATDYSAFAGRIVRFGSYGDPAAVPVRIWEGIAAHAAAFTGYTHQWRKCDARFARYCMASADNESEAREARAAGWRTFRVALPCDAPRIEAEAVCPASKEAGNKLQCADCLACGGTSTGRRGSIVIQAHGGFAVMAAVKASQMRAARIVD
jgi:hypothetical protein